MIRSKKYWLLITCIVMNLSLHAQTTLKGGFEPEEYLQLLQVTHAQNAGLFPERPASDSGHHFNIPSPDHYTLAYRSPEVGLFNQWDLWMRKDSSLAVICIRGTIMKNESWLENFYAAMVPATGNITLNDSTVFHYKLAENPRAAVHVGWLTGLAYLAPSIIAEIQKCEGYGIRQFIIFGHSQGGALAFLVRSYLNYLPDSVISKDDIFKTYCSAAPKPGNLYYAYDFDYLTRGGWGFRVVNEKDWVPETPFSLQSLKDFNEVNPFLNIKPALKNSKFLVRLYATHTFNTLDRSSGKAVRKFQKILGHKVFMLIRKALPGLKEPAYAPTMNYMTAGVPVILMAYQNYDEDYPFNGKNYFIHHGLDAYYELILHDYRQ